MKTIRIFRWKLVRCLFAVIQIFSLPLLSCADSTNCIPAPSDLISWWRAEGNANDATDGNNGIVSGGVSFVTGKVGQAFSFNGFSSDVRIPASANLDVGLGNGFTIEAWISPADVASQHPLFEWNDGSFGVHLWHSVTFLGENGLYLNVVDTSPQTHVLTTAVGTLTNNGYQHVAATYNKADGMAALYINGTMLAQGFIGIFTPKTTGDLYLGFRPAGGGAGARFVGTMDEVGLYNRPLSPSEVQALYQAGSAGKCTGPSPPVIILQPTNRTVIVSESATFDVEVLGNPPLAYQWRFNGTNISGATNPTLMVSNVQLTNAGSYSVGVTNLYGSATSSNASLTVNPPSPCVSPPPGLVSWWRAEGDASDATGGNFGSLQNGAAFAVGKVGQAFSFDGVNDYVKIPYASNLNSMGTQVTIECWMKPDPSNPMNTCCQGLVTSDFYLIGIFSGFAPITGVSFAISTDNGAAFAQTPDGNGGGAVVSAGQWHHIAGTYDGAKLQLYVDGQAWGNPIPHTGAISPMPLNGFVAIGSEDGRTSCSPCVGNRYFKGLIDEVGIYNRALSLAEIQAIYQAGTAGKCTGPAAPIIIVQPTNQTGFVSETVTFDVTVLGTPPLAYQWQFNGTNILGATNLALTLFNAQLTNAGSYSVVVTNLYGSATSSNAVLTVNPLPPCVYPPSGLVSWWRAEGNSLDANAGNHGVLLGNATYSGGRVGQAFVFDGSGDAVLVGNPTNLQLQNFTIEAWIKRASSQIVSFGESGAAVFLSYGSGGYGFAMNSDGFLSLTEIGISGVTASAGITDTTFHHVAVTKSRSTVLFYIDGVSSSVPAYDPGFTFSTTAAIGARGDNVGNSFLGTIDELAIYNRALSTAEIQAIYNASISGKCTGPAAPIIIVQPTNQTRFVSETVTFDVTVLGTPPLAYQWQFNGTNILGATNSALSLFNTQFTNAGNYAVMVTNFYGSATSSNAVLTVNPAPPCVSPLSGLISWWRAEGDATDVVSGFHGALSNGVTFFSGEVGQAFDLNGTNAYVRVPDSELWTLGTNSFTIELWANFRALPDSILTEPGTVFIGHDEGPFNMNKWFFALGGGVLNFHVNNPTSGSVFLVRAPFTPNTNQWYHLAVVRNRNVYTIFRDGIPVGSETNSLAIPNPNTPLTIGQAEGYFMDGWLDEVSIYGRALSAPEIQTIYNARISGKCVVPVPPMIVSHPRNTNVIAGANVTLSVVAGGSVPLSYQWRYNGTNISNANGSALILTNVQLSQIGNYSVQVTNLAGSVLSSNASLTVTFPPAILQAVNTNAMSGGPVTVPIVLVANGNENSLGFSLNFSTARLSYKRLMLGSGASGAGLVVYTNQVNLGRLGVVAVLSGGATFPAGTQEVVKVIFDSPVLLGASSVPTTVSFGDQPISRQLSDAQFQTLPANYVSGTVTLLPTAYEGDVAPRPNGNQSYANADWLQAGRFAARLDIPTAGSEFQRADCAPRSTLGDAQIKVTDWVQTGRYSLGSDPLTLVGGPTSEVASPTTPVPGDRQLRVVNASALQGLTVTIPVNLEAQGDENAVGFTLAFDSAKFNYSSASLGGAASGATLNLNTSQVASGRLGVALALPIGNSFVAGTREIVQVNLTAKSFAVINSSVSFSDQLVPRAVSDPLANELPSDYIAGNAIVNGVPPLSITRSGSNVTLAWPTWAASFNLQSSSNLLSAGSWTNVIATAQTNGPDLVVTLPIVENTKFFRLQNP